MKRLLRDPLLHFALLGAALFVAFTLLENPATQATEIVITQAQQRQLAAAFERAWRRPPNAAEIEGLLEDRVREELANREARALGLGRDDPVIRRRLRQKYEALVDQIASSGEPDADALDAWLTAHADRYREEARFTLQQLFFSADAREDAEAEAREALARIADSGPDSTPPRVGDSIGLDRRFADAREDELGGRFGVDFAAALSGLPVGRWSGPVPSAYGFHLVYVEAMTPARLPELAEVREEVLRDWREAQLREARDRAYATLRERYRVTIEAPPRQDNG